MIGKKFVCAICVALICSSYVFGQTYIMFDCLKFYSDVEIFNSLDDGTNKSRAKAIMGLNKMNSDKAVEWQYVVYAKDSINIQQFMNTVKRWQKQAFTSDKVVKEETENSILYEAFSPQAAFITGYLSATSISVNLRLRIEVKEDRIRVTGNVQHYHMGSANLAGPESTLHVVGSVYPFVNTKHKESFSMAYINSNVRIVNLMASFFEYINKNYNTVQEQIKEEENW